MVEHSKRKKRDGDGEEAFRNLRQHTATFSKTDLIWNSPLKSAQIGKDTQAPTLT